MRKQAHNWVTCPRSQSKYYSQNQNSGSLAQETCYADPCKVLIITTGPTCSWVRVEVITWGGQWKQLWIKGLIKNLYQKEGKVGTKNRLWGMGKELQQMVMINASYLLVMGLNNWGIDRKITGWEIKEYKVRLQAGPSFILKLPRSLTVTPGKLVIMLVFISSF